MEAIIIRHHPKMMRRWAHNVIQWYKQGGPKLAAERTKFLTPEDVAASAETVKIEFTKAGFKM